MVRAPLALTAWLVGAIWLVGSHFVGSPPAVVQQDTMQTAGIGEAAQKIAEEPLAQKVDLEPTGTLQSPGAKDVIGLGSAKPHLVQRRPKSALPWPRFRPRSSPCGENPRKSPPRQKTGSIASASGSRRCSLPIPPPKARDPQRRPPGNRRTAGRGDAFDPSQNPNAPGAPRPLGTLAPRAIAKDLAAKRRLDEEPISRELRWP